MFYQTTRTFHRAAYAASASVLLLSLAACGGSSLPTASPHETALVQQKAQPAAAGLLQETPERRAQMDAEWQAILAEPGVPGEDYDPNRLTVFYKPGLRQTSALSADMSAARQLAAGKSNAILRENQQYETVTGAIALQFNLEIETQAYINDCNFAGFSLPGDADGEAVLAGIRSQFADSIEWATYSRLLHKCYTVNDTDYINSTTTNGGLWGHKRVRCGEAWDYTRGSASVRIAVVDTGVHLSHEELALRVLNPQAAFPTAKCDLANNDNSMEDSDGHGTFIAGLICAQGNNGRTIVGVAHDCEVIPIKIANGGSAADDRLAAGCLLAKQLGAKVVNLSWGDEHMAGVLESMVNELVRDNVLFVAAAGNEATTQAHYPSDYVNAVSVGWTYNSDQRTQYPDGHGGYSGSNYGDGVDICAPGEELKSSDCASNSAYVVGGGTSYAAPIVAAAAGLLYTMEPTLSISEVRRLLEDTGAPTTGFSSTNPPLRLDIAAAMAELGRLKLTAPVQDKLIHEGSVVIQPEVRGTPDRVEYYVNNELATTVTSAPWAAEIDLTSIDFDNVPIRIHGVQGQDSSDCYMSLLVDNSSGNFPVVERFDQPLRSSFASVDMRRYTESVVSAIKQANPSGWNGWTYADVVANGQGAWVDTTTEVYSAPHAMYCGMTGDTYGNYETDALISRLIDLSSVSDPTLVFQQCFNLYQGRFRNDQAWVLVSEDDGVTWARAQQRGSGEAVWNGYQSEWGLAQVDLSAYAGKQIRIALLMESNGDDNAGENTDEPAGWWVDDIVVAMDYLANVPTLGSVSVPPYTVMGEVPDVLELPLAVSDPQDVAQVTYYLDLAPYGIVGVEDIVLPVGTAPFSSTLILSNESAAPNQLALLHVSYYGEDSTPGPEITIPVWIFNHRGDVNADGVVDQADFDAYPAMVGLTNADAGYVPFFDTNLDGIITESDACSVGYNWGG